MCGDHLAVTRLGCSSCGSELAGVFTACPYCSLDDADTTMLRVFLRSRGNMREVEKHLGVSYPTARLRVSQLLDKLGLADEPEPPPLNREQILSEVAAGALDPRRGPTAARQAGLSLRTRRFTRETGTSHGMYAM